MKYFKVSVHPSYWWLKLQIVDVQYICDNKKNEYFYLIILKENRIYKHDIKGVFQEYKCKYSNRYLFFSCNIESRMLFP